MFHQLFNSLVGMWLDCLSTIRNDVSISHRIVSRASRERISRSLSAIFETSGQNAYKGHLGNRPQGGWGALMASVWIFGLGLCRVEKKQAVGPLRFLSLPDTE